MRRRGWQSYLASILLLWVVVDLSVPGVCRSDAEVEQGTQAVLGSSPPNPGGAQQSRFDYEDDCFCCCSHIVPRPHFELSAGLLSSLADLALLEGQPDGSVPTLYHPPRN